jgi:hypothetical protein
MHRRPKITSFIFLLAVGLLVQPALARLKTPRAAKKKLVATTNAAVAPKPPDVEQGKVILVLQTRDNLITVRSSAGEDRYSVATLQGIALAEHLSVNELKDRFPELHEIVQGIAWAGAADRLGLKPVSPTY